MSDAKSDNVKAAGRTLDLFELFARKRAPLSLSEIAQAIGSPVSSTHALVKTLRARGFVYALDDRKLIYPTKRIFTVAQNIAENDPILELVVPHMIRLGEACGETVILGKRQGNRILYLEVLEAANVIRYSARPGDTKPLHSSSIGKAMLSLLPDAELLALLKKEGQPRVTDTTIIDAATLVENIARARDGHVFVTRGENVADVLAMATPVQVSDEHFGIAVAGPMPRMAAKEEECAERLRTLRAEFAEMNRTSRFR